MKQGRLVVLGVAQEQHADRCRLFAQWKGIDFPILHDPINLLGPAGVPIVVAIDERGIVRAVGPERDSLGREFVDRDFSSEWRPAGEGEVEVVAAKRPDVDALGRAAGEGDSAAAWTDYGDALAVWGGDERLTDAIGAYDRALELAPDDADVMFRQGVCLRARSETGDAQAGDFQRAVALWGEALASNPNQYIWRRRIEQYGPRLGKPYPFYDWVETAREEIVARGEVPVALRAEPSGTEIAQPARSVGDGEDPGENPDPKGLVNHDEGGLVRADVTVAPARVAPGGSARVHVTFTLDELQGAHWNNEAQPLRVWVDLPEGWRAAPCLSAAAQPAAADSTEVRRVDFEVQAPENAEGEAALSAYALYFVCEDVGGVCSFLRQDIPIRIDISR